MGAGYFDTSYGNWLPEERSEEPVVNCTGCYANLFAGEEVVVLDGECFCDMDCLSHYIGARVVELEEDELY